jgi:hypothetical protein
MTGRSTVRSVLRRWDALLLAGGMRISLALAIGLPSMSALLTTGIADHPDADRLLFDAGGLMLVEGVRLSLAGISSLTKLTLLLATLSVLLSLLPTSLVLVALDDRALRLSESLGRGARRIPALFAIYGVCLLLQVIVFGLAAFLGGWASRQLAGDLSPAWAAGTGALLFSLGVGLNCGIGVARDLSFAAAIRRPKALPALLSGVGALLAHPLRVGVDWARLAAWQWVLVLAAAYLGGRLPVSGAWTIGLGALYLAVFAGVTLLRATWAARSLVHAGADAPMPAAQPAATMA